MIEDADKWPTIHLYRKASAFGLVPAIKCPEDDEELVVVVGRDEYPALKCLSCRVVWSIGLDVWEQITANVDELYQGKQ